MGIDETTRHFPPGFCNGSVSVTVSVTATVTVTFSATAQVAKRHPRLMRQMELVRDRTERWIAREIPSADGWYRDSMGHASSILKYDLETR